MGSGLNMRSAEIMNTVFKSWQADQIYEMSAHGNS